MTCAVPPGIFEEFFALSCALGVFVPRSLSSDPRPHFRDVYRRLHGNPMVIDYLERFTPRSVRTYRQLNQRYQVVQQEIETAQRSPPIKLPTPKEAEWRFKKLLHEGKPMRVGKTQCHNPELTFFYYSSLKRGRDGDEFFRPEITFKMNIDRRHGIDLAAIKEQLGLESIGFITPFEHREVFRPASEDRLSALAAFDLSQGFTHPLRLFEPEVSKYTKVKRHIRTNALYFGYLLFSFAGLLAGFPEPKSTIAAVYSPLYAEAYSNIAHYARPLHNLIHDAVILCIQILFLLIAIPYFCAVAAARASVWGARNLLGPALVTTITSLLTMNAKAWLTFIGLLWILTAEFKSSTSSS